MHQRFQTSKAATRAQVTPTAETSDTATLTAPPVLLVVGAATAEDEPDAFKPAALRPAAVEPLVAADVVLLVDDAMDDVMEVVLVVVLLDAGDVLRVLRRMRCRVWSVETIRRIHSFPMPHLLADTGAAETDAAIPPTAILATDVQLDDAGAGCALGVAPDPSGRIIGRK